MRSLIYTIILLVVASFAARADYDPYYLNRVDIQRPDQQFVIESSWLGDNVYLAFDLFDGGISNPVPSLDGWNFVLFYAKNQYATQGVYVVNSGVSSNRVFFKGINDAYLNSVHDYFVILTGVRTNGMTKTFGTGRMNVEYTAMGDVPSVLKLSNPLNWNAIGPYAGAWPIFPGENISILTTPTGIVISGVADIALAVSNLAAAAYAIATNAPTIAQFADATNALYAAQTNETAARLQLEQDFYNQLSSITLSGGVSVVMGGSWHSDEYASQIIDSSVARDLPASNTVVTLEGYRANRYYMTGGAVDHQLELDQYRNNTNATLVWSVTPTNIASIDAYGFITAIAPGVITVSVSFGRSALSTNIRVDVSTNLVYDNEIPGPTNYLRYALVKELYERSISNANLSIFSSFSHATTSYVYSTTGLLHHIDLSPFPWWWSTYQAKSINGALITPKHVLTTEHHAPRIRNTVRFVTTNNIVVERTVIAQRILTSDAAWTDAAINELNAPITNINPVKVMGGGATAYLMPVDKYPMAYNAQFNLPVVALPQYPNALIINWLDFSRQFTKPPEPYWADKYRLGIRGDSGSPLFLLIGDTPVLIGLTTMNSWAPAGTRFPSALSENIINDGLSAMGSSYTLTLYTNYDRFTPLMPLP